MNTKLIRKITAWLIIASIAMASVSCGSQDNDTDTGEIGENTTTQAPETEEAVKEFEYANLDGYSLDVLKVDQTKIAWSNNTFDPEKEDGEILNDIIYRRNSFIEVKMNCTIAEATEEKLPDIVRKNVQGDDDTYDLYMEKLRDMAALTAEGFFYEIHEIDTIDLTKSYWDQDFISDTSVMGKNYMLVGDLLLTTADCLYTIIYNKTLAESHDITGLYDIVRDGKWTYETMLKYAAEITNDENGDGNFDEKDRYGMLAQRAADPIYAYIIGSGLSAFSLDGDGTPDFSAENERFGDVLSALVEFLNGRDSYDPGTHPSLKARDAITNMFGSDKALFLTQCVSAAGQYLRGIDQEFGFLPMPKFDEAQENYLSHVNMGAPVFFVPTTNKAIDKTGAVLEALAEYSSRELIPAYYETCFSGKYVRDDESYEMLKLALEHKVYDLGFIWKWGDFMNKTADLVKNNNSNIASTIEKLKPSVIKDIEATIEALSKEK